jgi:hypothetical protein
MRTARREMPEGNEWADMLLFALLVWRAQPAASAT